jgi:hypothetical protein
VAVRWAVTIRYLRLDRLACKEYCARSLAPKEKVGEATKCNSVAALSTKRSAVSDPEGEASAFAVIVKPVFVQYASLNSSDR